MDSITNVPVFFGESNKVDLYSFLDSILPLKSLINKHHPDMNKKDIYFVKEFILWALAYFKKLSKADYIDGFEIKDPYSNYISNI